MKSLIKITFLISLSFFTTDFFAQKIEVLTDMHKSNISDDHPLVIGDYVFSCSDLKFRIYNLKTDTEIYRAIMYLGSDYHKRQNLDKTLLDNINYSSGIEENGNAAFLVQSEDKKNHVNVTKIVIDSNLNIVNETLIVSYEKQGRVRKLVHNIEARSFRYDVEKEVYIYAEYTKVYGAKDYLRVLLFNKNMELFSDNEVHLDNPIGEDFKDSYVAYRCLNSIKLLDKETILINVQKKLFVVSDKELIPLGLELELTIHSYEIKPLEDFGFRMIGVFEDAKEFEESEEEKTFGLILIDFNKDLVLLNEDLIDLPGTCYKSIPQITGDLDKGLEEILIFDFEVSNKGITDLVLTLTEVNETNYTSRIKRHHNYSLVKLDENNKIIDEISFPFASDKHRTATKVLFEEEDIRLLTYVDAGLIVQNGSLNLTDFKKDKSDLTRMLMVSLKRTDYQQNESRFVDLISPHSSYFDWKKHIVFIEDVQLENGGYRVVVKGFYNDVLDHCKYIGRLTF